MSDRNRLNKYMSRCGKQVDRALRKYLARSSTPPSRIHEAMRYSIFAGGKRLRPVLVMVGAEVCGGEAKDVLPTACALEMIHTYSLVHDDLPAMDNDDLRRGRPTSHRVYGEAVAILTGDALLTKAFELISLNIGKRVSPDQVTRVIRLIADAAGSKGMVGGQIADLQGQGKGSRANGHQAGKQVKFIHTRKTAALICASLMAGGILAGASDRQNEALKRFGFKIGLAFQIADDVLDIIGNKKILGKNRSDKDNHKMTYPAVYGVESSRKQARQLVMEAKEELKIFNGKAWMLKDLADYIVERNH